MTQSPNCEERSHRQPEHLKGDNGRFFAAVAMQVAAHETKLGHGKLAEELRALIDKAKTRVTWPHSSRSGARTASWQPFWRNSYPKVRLGDSSSDPCSPLMCGASHASSATRPASLSTVSSQGKNC